MKTARFLVKKEIKEVLNKLNLVREDFSNAKRWEMGSR